MSHGPTVSVLIPTLNEEVHLPACLASLAVQTWDDILEIFVIDGGSSDRTVEVAAAVDNVRVLENPRRLQAAALNIGLAEARGDVIVRVDGHCVLEPTYVERAVRALEESGAGMVGGPMHPVGATAMERAVALAMTMPLGAGPARFHTGGGAGWTDTVYLGVFRRTLLRDLGGWAEDVGVNEDAELAHRVARASRGVWFDPSISSRYTPRGSVRGVAEQFFRYGRSRAATARRHPRSAAVRQAVAPALVIGLALPTRRLVAPLYLAGLAAVVARTTWSDLRLAARLAVVLPAMHVPWGTGFLVGLVLGPPPRRPRRSHATS